MLEFQTICNEIKEQVFRDIYDNLDDGKRNREDCFDNAYDEMFHEFLDGHVSQLFNHEILRVIGLFGLDDALEAYLSEFGAENVRGSAVLYCIINNEISNTRDQHFQEYLDLFHDEIKASDSLDAKSSDDSLDAKSSDDSLDAKSSDDSLDVKTSDTKSSTSGPTNLRQIIMSMSSDDSSDSSDSDDSDDSDAPEAKVFVQAAEDAICTVCQEDFQEPAPTTRLPCGHLFHVECIDPWVASRNQCPTCRLSVLDEDSEEEESEEESD